MTDRPCCNPECVQTASDLRALVTELTQALNVWADAVDDLDLEDLVKRGREAGCTPYTSTHNVCACCGGTRVQDGYPCPRCTVGGGD